MKKIIIAIIVCILAIGAYFLIRTPKAAAPESIDTASSTEISDGSSRTMGIEDYVRANISFLSPMPAVLGGTLFVTDIEAKDGSGVVHYEDGHNAYVADFKYKIDENTGVNMIDFKVRR